MRLCLRWGCIYSNSASDWGFIKIPKGWGCIQEWGCIQVDTANLQCFEGLKSLCVADLGTDLI